MPDFASVWVPAEGRADWAVVGPDLQPGGDLETSVIISLFSDQRADEDDTIPDGSTDRRGWWGDLGEDRPIGSKLWLLERRKATAQTLTDAKDYATDALAWMIADGVAAGVEVTASWVKPNWLGLRIVIDEPDGKQAVFQYQWAWAGIASGSGS